jgi:hypothetical protein
MMQAGEAGEATSSWPRGALAMAMLTDARSYLIAARRLAAGDLRGVLRPTYFLLGHALELAIKAFLAAKDVSDDELERKIGHDLKRAYRKALKCGLHEGQEHRALVDKIAPFHKGLSFRYRKLDFDSVPEFERCAAITDAVTSAIEPAIMHTYLRDIKIPYNFDYLTVKPEQPKGR